MKTYDCIKEWTKRCIESYVFHKFDLKDIYYKANSVKAKNNILYSYSTPICKFENGTFKYSLKKYSRTTSKHQSYMRGCVIDICSRYCDVVRCRPYEDINNINMEDYNT